MTLRIDEGANALDGWLAEWREKRHKVGAVGSADQLSSGRSDAPAIPHGTTACCESAPIQPYQGNSEPSADDGYPDDEPYWSDSDTAREFWRDKGAK